MSYFLSNLFHLNFFDIIMFQGTVIFGVRKREKSYKFPSTISINHVEIDINFSNSKNQFKFYIFRLLKLLYLKMIFKL
jgi:hypothetical protein